MPGFDLSTLLSCSYGTSAFQVENVSVDSVPVVKANEGRTGTKITVQIDGYISADDPADLTTALTAAYANLGIDGQDCVVSGINGNPLLALYAAQCADGGPHIEWNCKPGGTPIRMDFRLKVHGEIRGIGNPPSAVDTWKLSTHVRVDDLKEIVRTGEVSGVSAPSYFLSVVLPQFEQAFPDPNWVTEYVYESSGDANKTKASYRTSARQTATPLPNSGLAEAVDGDSSTRIERDEQQRLVTTYDYDLVIVGSPTDMLTWLRNSVMQQATAANQIIWKESSSTTYIRERRLRASFVTLQAGGGNPLMNFSQSLEINTFSDTYEVKTYAGADPIVVQRPSTVETLTQSGSATCQGAYLKAPTALYLTYLEPPDVRYEDLGDGVQYRTSWKYVVYTAGGGGSGGTPGTIGVLTTSTQTQLNGGVSTGAPTAALAPSGTAFNVNGTGLKFLARSQQGGFIKAGW